MTDIYGQLRGISCDRAVGIGPNKVLSVPDAIAQALAQHEREKEGVQQELLPMPQPVSALNTAAQMETERQMDFDYNPGEAFIGTCPECKSDLQFSEGCVKCLSCGYSECG
jgi:ribonucleoside-diphosphate reductase alpha chain